MSESSNWTTMSKIAALSSVLSLILAIYSFTSSLEYVAYTLIFILLLAYAYDYRVNSLKLVGDRSIRINKFISTIGGPIQEGVEEVKYPDIVVLDREDRTKGTRISFSLDTGAQIKQSTVKVSLSQVRRDLALSELSANNNPTKQLFPLADSQSKDRSCCITELTDNIGTPHNYNMSVHLEYTFGEEVHLGMVNNLWLCVQVFPKALDCVSDENQYTGSCSYEFKKSSPKTWYSYFREKNSRLKCFKGLSVISKYPVVHIVCPRLLIADDS